MQLPISFDPQKVSNFCERNHIRRLALFGSVLRDDFHAGSDVDFLVFFQDGHTPGYFGIVRMGRELSEMLGDRKADLRTARELSPYFREDVLTKAKVIYDS